MIKNDIVTNMVSSTWNSFGLKHFNNAFQIYTNLFVLFWNIKCVIMKTTTSYCFAI